MYVFIFEEPGEVSRAVKGRAFGDHRSVNGVEVEAPNLLAGLEMMKEAIEENEERWVGIPDG
jgi:hypothetical protein